MARVPVASPFAEAVFCLPFANQPRAYSHVQDALLGYALIRFPRGNCPNPLEGQFRPQILIERFCQNSEREQGSIV